MNFSVFADAVMRYATKLQKSLVPVGSVGDCMRKNQVLPGLEPGLQGSEPWVLTNYTIEPISLVAERGRRGWDSQYSRNGVGLDKKKSLAGLEPATPRSEV